MPENSSQINPFVFSSYPPFKEFSTTSPPRDEDILVNPEGKSCDEPGLLATELPLPRGMREVTTIIAVLNQTIFKDIASPSRPSPQTNILPYRGVVPLILP